MSLLTSIKSLYKLETLDHRFVTSSKAPPPEPAKPHAIKGEKLRGASPLPDAKPSLWKTTEYIFYIVYISICVALMCNCIYQISKPSHVNYKNFVELLEPGWIPGRKVDNSDTQYATFRENVPYLFLLTIIHPLLRKVYNYGASTANPSGGTQASLRDSGDSRMKQRLRFDFLFGLVFLVALHGFSALKVLFILYTNFSIGTKLPKNYVVVTTWIFNISILFANELCAGYSYRSIARLVTPWVVNANNWGDALDSYGGIMPRWEILFNFTILRLISFNMDYYWSLKKPIFSVLEKKQLDPSNLSERDRVDVSARPEDYSFENSLSYTLYAPLYLTGPIISFNDYISQSRYKPKSVTSTGTLMYGLRFLICLLTMEVMLHFQYSVAICKAKPAWEVYSPFELSMLGYFNLHIIWLKLLIPWRCSRTWALIDEIDPPENMVRCMSDNYSTLKFWRSWHRSYNRWTIRYIYIPLGGSGGSTPQGKIGTVRVIANYLAVFTFVALWHDINLRLLTWGWLITLFILPEVLATLAFPSRKWRNHPTLYRALCAFGATANILMMMVANLVGFAIGLDGVQGLLHGILGSYSGLFYMAVACSALYCATHVMFEVREEEKRHGIKMSC